MTVKDYITSKFQSFGYKISDADLLDVYNASGLSELMEVDADNTNLINLGLIAFIPSLLLHPKSISENGFSMSWDVKGMKEFYSYLCVKYGKEDTLTDKPRIIFL